MQTSAESPGIYRENSTIANYSLTAQEYYENIQQYYAFYFHLGLIKMGVDNSITTYDFNNNISPCGITFSQMKNLVHYYLRNVRSYSYSDYSIDSTFSNVRSFVIQKVTAGIPVITILTSSVTYASHVVVIYDYDSTTDKLYGHFGKVTGTYDSTHVDISESGYDTFGYAFTIEMNNSHNCSDNYRYISGTNQTDYCSCYYSIHPSHNHNKYCNYIWYNTLKHKRICIDDNNMANQPHIVDINSIVPGQMYATCLLCGGTAEIGFLNPNNNGNLIVLPNGVVIINTELLNYYSEVCPEILLNINYDFYEKQLYAYAKKEEQ